MLARLSWCHLGVTLQPYSLQLSQLLPWFLSQVVPLELVLPENGVGNQVFSSRGWTEGSLWRRGGCLACLWTAEGSGHLEEKERRRRSKETQKRAPELGRKEKDKFTGKIKSREVDKTGAGRV